MLLLYLGNSQVSVYRTIGPTLVVICDGLPYCLAHKLIHDAYYCLNCQGSVLGIERFKEHNKSEW